MAGWVFWIIAAIVLAVGEMLTLSFFLAPFAGGALLAAIVDAAGGGVILSWGIFILASLLLLLVVRPIARSHRKMPAQLRTGTAALIGRRGLVVERVANDEAVGAIRIDNGEGWAAPAYGAGHVIDVGTRGEGGGVRGGTGRGPR